MGERPGSGPPERTNGRSKPRTIINVFHWLINPLADRLITMWEILKELTNPQSIIKAGGLALLLFVVFAETGLMVGFFLPGDSLIFISGLICATKPQLLN